MSVEVYKCILKAIYSSLGNNKVSQGRWNDETLCERSVPGIHSVAYGVENYFGIATVLFVNRLDPNWARNSEAVAGGYEQVLMKQTAQGSCVRKTVCSGLSRTRECSDRYGQQLWPN